MSLRLSTLIVSNSVEEVKRTKNSLLQEFNMIDMGEVKYFLRFTIERDQNSSYRNKPENIRQKDSEKI